MITTKYQSNGIRFHIEFATSRRELEARALDIKPDLSLMTSGQRKRAMSHRLDEVRKARKS